MGADSAPRYFLAVFKGPTSMGREARGRKRGEEKGKGREGERGRRGGEGERDGRESLGGQALQMFFFVEWRLMGRAVSVTTITRNACTDLH